jgi:DNA-binding Lrp family transcriptional regulator
MENLREKPAMLDKKDKKILYELTLDARRPLTGIRKNTSMSEPAMNYRIKRMMNSGIISGFKPLVCVDKLGMNLYRVYLRTKNKEHNGDGELIEHMKNNRNVFALHSTVGKWDLIIDFVAKNSKEFFSTLASSCNRFHGIIGDCQILNAVCSARFKRKYLADYIGNAKTAHVFEGENERDKLDGNDLNILKRLSLDGRAKNFDIAKKTGINQTTVKKRIKRMEEKGIIQGVSARVHPIRFGAYSKKFLIKMSDFPSVYDRLVEFSKSEPNVVGLDRVIGSWNYELSAECNGRDQVSEVTKKIKGTFSDVIEEMDIVDIDKSYDVTCPALFE